MLVYIADSFGGRSLNVQLPSQLRGYTRSFMRSNFVRNHPTSTRRTRRIIGKELLSSVSGFEPECRGISDIGAVATKLMRQRRDPKTHNRVKGDDDLPRWRRPSE
jgi:hypothetical protein